MKNMLGIIVLFFCLSTWAGIDGVSTRFQLSRQLEVATGIQMSGLDIDEGVLRKFPVEGRVDELNPTFLRAWIQASYSACSTSMQRGSLATHGSNIAAKKYSFKEAVSKFFLNVIGETISNDELKKIEISSTGVLKKDLINMCTTILNSPKVYLITR